VWLANRNAAWAFALQDALGVLLCCLFLRQLRLATLRTCALALAAFFAYDVFMVFLTPWLFGGHSVMIDVATAGAPTPVANEACYCRLHPQDAGVCGPGETMPILLRLPRLDDYRGGSSMLGLGDIVLPGLLLSFALRADYEGMRGQAARAGSDADVVLPAPAGEQGFESGGAGCLGVAGGAGGGGSTWRRILALLARQGVVADGYWPVALVGYAVGLMVANLAVAIFQAGQPALLYLVPLTVGPVALRAHWRGELDALWRGRGVGIGGNALGEDGGGGDEAAGGDGNGGGGGGGGGDGGGGARRASLIDNDALALLQSGRVQVQPQQAAAPADAAPPHPALQHA